MREYCSVMTSWRNCSSVASAEMATMFGRGVMTSRTTLSPNSTTDWMSLRSSSWINPSSVPAEMRASTFSAEVGSSAGAPQHRDRAEQRAQRQQPVAAGAAVEQLGQREADCDHGEHDGGDGLPE